METSLNASNTISVFLVSIELFLTHTPLQKTQRLVSHFSLSFTIIFCFACMFVSP